jgi:hypothetical protein
LSDLLTFILIPKLTSNAFQIKINDTKDVVKQKVISEFEAFAKAHCRMSGDFPLIDKFFNSIIIFLAV